MPRVDLDSNILIAGFKFCRTCFLMIAVCGKKVESFLEIVAYGSFSDGCAPKIKMVGRYQFTRKPLILNRRFQL